MTSTIDYSMKRGRGLCVSAADVFKLTMTAQTRALARTNKEKATKESVRAVMRDDCLRLGIQDLDTELPPVIHVAGTKGKGSTCAFIESILRAANLRTALFTSPHLVDIRERIRVNGRLLAQDVFDQHVMDTYRQLGDRIEDVGFFQFMTLMTFRMFALNTKLRERVDVLILETGIGGRLDFTNAMDRPLCGVITKLDYDHMELLGTSLAEIASEKAGIVKRNVKLFTPNTQASEGLPVIIQACKMLDAPLEIVPPLTKGFELGIHGGTPQLENAALASAVAKYALSTLSSKDRTVDVSILTGLKNCRFPGRAQIEENKSGLRFYLDGAHTPLSVEFATQWFADTVPARDRKALIFHCSPDRDGTSMMKLIKKLVPDLHRAYFSAPTSGINAGSSDYHDHLAKIWSSLDAKNDAVVIKSGPAQFKSILEDEYLKGQKHIFVVGSFYIVSDALRYWVDDWNVENAFTRGDVE